MTRASSTVEHNADKPKLVVLLHGMMSSPRDLQEVKDVVVDTYAWCEIFEPRLAYAGWNGFTSKHPSQLVAELVEQICERWRDAGRKGQPFGSIVLVGHSLGGLLARKLAIVAYGEISPEQAPFEPELAELREPREWAGAIERIVLLAGVTKGIAADTANDWWTQQKLRAAFAVAECVAHNGIITQSRQGYPFIVQTRLQWLALFSHPQHLPEKQKRPSNLQVVQLIGTRDGLVAPDDTIDLVDLLSAPESFTVLELPDTDHTGARQVRSPHREPLFRAALTHTANQLANNKANVVASRDKPRVSKPELYVSGTAPDPHVTDVTFVVHGIRDRGHWTRKIARKIEIEVKAADDPECPRSVRSMTASYGYLTMLPFLWLGVRRSRAAWLMDRYVEMRALYPKACFHYVGHSNGTYLAARALKDYPAARFTRVVFAGSVVRRDYDWNKLLSAKGDERPRVGQLLNYVATSDCVVALFPNGLQFLSFFDLGGAGHTGFRLFDGARANGTLKTANNNSYQIEYISGGHGAGIKESQWDDIANFVAFGREPKATDPDYTRQQSLTTRLLGLVAPTALLTIIALLLSIFAVTWYFLPIPIRSTSVWLVLFWVLWIVFWIL